MRTVEKPVSYTHLDVYKRQGARLDPSQRAPGLAADPLQTATGTGNPPPSG